MFMSVGASTWWITPSRSVILIFMSLISYMLPGRPFCPGPVRYWSLYGFDYGLGGLLFATVKAGHSPYGRIFHYIFFIGMDPLVGTLAHQGGFVEPTKDQFQFSGIGVHIPYGIDARHIGLVVQGIVNQDRIFFDFEAPIRNGTQFWG